MAKAILTSLIASLKSNTREFSSNECAKNHYEAQKLINQSELLDTEKEKALKVLSNSADRAWGHWNDSGVSGLITYLIEESEKPTFTPKVKRTDLLKLFGNKIVNVTFTKRTTGAIRSMNCRLGVTSKLKGGAKSFSDKDKGLLTVYDMVKQAYRSIPLESIKSITTGGICHQFNH